MKLYPWGDTWMCHFRSLIAYFSGISQIICKVATFLLYPFTVDIWMIHLSSEDHSLFPFTPDLKTFSQMYSYIVLKVFRTYSALVCRCGSKASRPAPASVRGTSWSCRSSAVTKHSHRSPEGSRNKRLVCRFRLQRPLNQQWNNLSWHEHNGEQTYMFPKDIWVRPERLGVRIPDEPDDVVDTPGGRVLIGWSFGLLGLWSCIINAWKNDGNE